MRTRVSFPGIRVFIGISLVFVFCVTSVFAAGIPVRDWAVPSSSSQAGKFVPTTSAVPTIGPNVFIKVTPCRVVDTRNPSGPFGGPSFLPGTTRSFVIPSSTCGVPVAQAYSLNFTIVNYDSSIGANGFITAFPSTTARPVVSTLNFGNGDGAIANAAIVPASTTGSIDVFASGTTNLIIDINGYFSNSVGTVQPLQVFLSSPGQAAVLGENFDNTNGSHGVGGYEGGTGVVHGVQGQVANTGNTAGSSGVHGIGGVVGDTSGVLGETGSASFSGTPGFFSFDVGVKGRGIRGVIGAGTNVGVVGIHVDGTGANDAQALLGNNTGSAFSGAGNGFISGNWGVGGTLTKAAGTFKIDHPLDPENKYLYHSFVESPDMMNIYNGVISLDRSGQAVVMLPEYFQALNKDFRYQLTSIGRPQPNLYIAEEISANMFRIAGGAPGARVSWTVTGVRHDVYADAHRVVPEVWKAEAERGHFLHPAERGEPISTSIQAAYAKTPEELAQLAVEERVQKFNALKEAEARKLQIPTQQQ